MIHQEHPTLADLIDYTHRELSAPDDAAVSAHLRTCTTCSELHQTEVRLGEMLREHAQAEEREMPPGLRERILSAAQADPSPSWWQRLSSTWRAFTALPVAAAAAFALYIGIHALHGGAARAASVDAAYYLEDHAALATTVPFSEGAAIPTMLTSQNAMGDERTVDEAR